MDAGKGIIRIGLSDMIDAGSVLDKVSNVESLDAVWNKLPEGVRGAFYLHLLLKKAGKSYLLDTMSYAEVVELDDCPKVSVTVYPMYGEPMGFSIALSELTGGTAK